MSENAYHYFIHRINNSLPKSKKVEELETLLYSDVNKIIRFGDSKLYFDSVRQKVTELNKKYPKTSAHEVYINEYNTSAFVHIRSKSNMQELCIALLVIQGEWSEMF